MLGKALALATLATCLSTASAQQTVHEQSPLERVGLRYLQYLPIEYATSDDLFPFVLFLHGGGEGGDEIERVKKHGLPKLIEAGRQFPFIVVSPQNPSHTQFWDDQQLIRLLDQLQRELRIDPDRIYLTGLSRGAYGAWRLAIQNPDRFAALVPIAGGGAMPYAKRIKHLPIWAFHGKLDSVIPASEVERMIAAIREAGGDPKLTIYPDAEHDSWTEAYNDPQLYEWMLRQQRSSN